MKFICLNILNNIQQKGVLKMDEKLLELKALLEQEMSNLTDRGKERLQDLLREFEGNENK